LKPSRPEELDSDRALEACLGKKVKSGATFEFSGLVAETFALSFCL
jgi:hypothetical protein